MVVDDEWLHADHSHRTLQRAGWRVPEIVCDPDQAIMRTEVCKPDCVLLDICFPGNRRGFDLLADMRRVSNLRGFAPPFAVFLTGHGDDVTRAEAQAVPGSLYREKPISDEDLVEALDEAFRRLPDWHAETAPKQRTGDGWSAALNGERLWLIEKQYRGTLDAKDESRLLQLQEQQAEWLREHVSFDTSRAEKVLKQLRELPDRPNK